MSKTKQKQRGEKVLEATNITHSFGELDVLDGLSVSLRRGEVCALVGANGSGKTTLMRILAGLLTPDDGEVETDAGDAARTVGYLPQQPSFRGGFTAGESLRFYARLLSDEVSEGYVEDALEAVGLSEARERNVSGLSGGMTRLLGVAQARVGDPPIMMLDEPTSGLDPEMTGRIFGTLGDLADEGKAVVITTHDLEKVERDADEMVMIHDGVVELSGAPKEVVEENDADDVSEVFDSIVREKRGGRG
jgi:ABC-type multidrug transport system ATPase subunit